MGGCEAPKEGGEGDGHQRTGVKPAPASPVGGVGTELGPEAPLDAGRGHCASR